MNKISDKICWKKKLDRMEGGSAGVTPKQGFFVIVVVVVRELISLSRLTSPHSHLHVMRPCFDTRYVTLVLRVGRGHVRMAHLRARVRIVRIVGGGYVLHGGKGGLKFVISDYVRLCSILPRSFAYRLRFRAVSLARSLHLFVVSEKRRVSKRNRGREGEREGRDIPSLDVIPLRFFDYLLNIHGEEDEVVVGAGTCTGGGTWGRRYWSNSLLSTSHS